MVWFFGLGFGARRLAGLFASPGTWRVLDGLIAVTMVAPGFVAVSDIGSLSCAQPTRVPGTRRRRGATAACSRDGATGDSNGKAVIEHVFGETTVPSRPSRVVSAGLTEQDDLLAVGVVPVAVTNSLRDQPAGVWPWAQPKLGTAKPALLNLDNGNLGRSHRQPETRPDRGDQRRP